MGCQFIAKLCPGISSGFPDNSPEPIYSLGWRSAVRTVRSPLPKTTIKLLSCSVFSFVVASNSLIDMGLDGEDNGDTSK